MKLVKDRIKMVVPDEEAPTFIARGWKPLKPDSPAKPKKAKPKNPEPVEASENQLNPYFGE